MSVSSPSSTDPNAAPSRPCRQTKASPSHQPTSTPGFERTPWPRPLFAATVALMGGMALGDSMPLPATVAPLGLILTLGAFGAFSWFHRRHPRHIPPSRPELLLLGMAFVGAWQSGGRVERHRQADPIAHWAATHWIMTVEGVLAEPPRHLGEITRLTLLPGARLQTGNDDISSPLPVRIEAPDKTGAVESQWRERWREAAPGDRVRAVGSFRPPGGWRRNPGGRNLPPTTRGEFILGPLRTHSTDDVVVLPPKKRSLANRLLAGVVRWGDVARDRLLEAGGARAGPVLLAVVLGDTSAIPRNSYRKFQRAGLLHLFSVSGLHAGILAVAVFGMLGMLHIPRRLQIPLILLTLFFYAALTGFRVPVVRTGIMAAALGAQSFLRRPTDSLSRLSLAALAILLLWPGSLFEAGFQMSFLAVFTLIVFGPWVAETVAFPRLANAGWRGEARRTAQFALRTVLMLTILQAALAPLLAHHFHQVSLIAPVSNLVVVPVVTGALLAGAAIAGPGVLFPGVASFLGPAATALANLAIWITEIATMLPFASIPARSFPPPGLVLYLALLFGGGYLLFARGPGDRIRRRASAMIHAAGLVVVLTAFPFFRPDPESRLRVVFLDVGQGDCILLQLPKDAGTILVDTGPPPRDRGNAYRIIQPVLRHYGIEAVDVLVATHGDLDHIGGIPDLLEDIPVRRILTAPGISGGSLWRDIESELETRRIQRLDTFLGARLRTGAPDLRIDVLHPDEKTPGARSDRNSDSVVLHVEWEGFSMLLTGDADLSSERLMLERWPETDLRAVVLKAGHHGSHSSTGDAFLEATRPAFVVFSCGRNNRFGHPHSETLERCRSREMLIHRTDLDGALVLETDGKKLWVTAYDE